MSRLWLLFFILRLENPVILSRHSTNLVRLVESRLARTQPVVIISTHRSGSGWLLRILESKSPPLDYRNKEPLGLLQRHNLSHQISRSQF